MAKQTLDEIGGMSRKSESSNCECLRELREHEVHSNSLYNKGKKTDSGWIARRASSDGETDIGRDRRHEQEERKLELRMTTRIARARSAQQFSL